MKVNIQKDWSKLLYQEFEKPYFEQLVTFVKNEYQQLSIFPPDKLIFSAFNQCPPNDIKVVILGQDPYHNVGQAHGLAFSVLDGIVKPPSLKNIFQEVRSDLNVPIPDSGNLTRWAQQGVLLLNAILTVKAHLAGSHQNRGWEHFTDAVIKEISMHYEHIVFLLWGSYAQKKGSIIDIDKHLVLKAPHPSPLSAHRGFFGCKHFSKTNEYLKTHNKQTIDW